MKLVSSRAFNQDVTRAKRLARDEPVFVTDRGRPTHVLLSIHAFRQLSGERHSIFDLLAMPATGDAEFDEGSSRSAWDRDAGVT